MFVDEVDIHVEAGSGGRGCLETFVSASAVCDRAKRIIDAGRGAALVRKVRESQADGVVFCIAKFCEPALYDYALLKRTLDAEGIRYCGFEFEEKMSIFESARTQVETFVESILLFS